MKTSLARRAAFCALLAGTCLTAPAVAQLPGSIPAPPVRQSVDDNGVDVLRGTFVTSQTPLSIGPDAENGFAYTFQSFNAGYRDAFQAFLSYSGSTYTVTLNGSSDTFTYNGSTFTNTEGRGTTLTGPMGLLTYTGRDGTVATFQLNTGGAPFYDAPQYRPLTVTRPNGLKVQYLYRNLAFCTDPQLDEFDRPYCPAGKTEIAQRLQSVSNSNGYMLKFSYAADTIDPYVYGTDYTGWSKLTSVKAINLGTEYCDGTADSCSLSMSWPQVIFSQAGSQYTVTDPANRATRYTSDASHRVTAIKRPGAASDNVTVSYGANGVSSLTRDGVTYTYSYVDSGTTRTTTVTDPLGKTRVYVGDTATNVLSSFTNEVGNTTSYLHDSQGRLTKVTAPEGNATQYTFDARGNVTQTDSFAKAGSGLATITTYAGFDATCSNAKTCNQPNWTKDAAGNQTDYAYDATHGGVLTVTQPAPTAGAPRPQTRSSYTGVQGYYRQSVGGSPAASGQTTYLLTGTSACQMNASCTGTADEVKTTISFGPQSAGTANNLLPVSTSSGAGDGSLTATMAVTYDSIGNATYVDGPLAGSADTSRTIYDAARQVVGQIGPDPDGAGVLKNRATKLTYNADGQVTLAEQGTTTGQTDTDWTAFTSSQQTQSGYDANARKTSDALTASGTTYSLAQYTYDSLGRLDCSALRMNPAAFASVTPSCSPGTGSFGSDRIVKASYDDASRLVGATSAYGTAEAGSDGALTFTANGKPQTFTDGEGHVTTLEYDGFDRLAKTRYPNASGGGSSTTDYEQPSYDSRSNVTQLRLRDGQVIGFGYDNLSRPTLMDLSGSGIDLDISYGYDLLGRLKTSSNPVGHLTNYGYDALGRIVNEATTYGGSRTSQYDQAGRRTRFTWSDGFYVDYDHLITGEVSAIRENGATSGVGVLATYSYDNLGRRTLITRGNGTTTGYSYDAVSRLSDLSQSLAGTTYDFGLTFAYNPAGQITSRTHNNDTYAFAGHANQDLTESVNGLNQLTQQGVNTVGHDARGNTNYIGGATFAYSQRNQLYSAAGKTLYYDPPGRLDLIYNGSGGTTFDFDGSNLVSEGDYNVGGYLRRYVWGPGTDEPVVWYEGSGTTDRRWFHADERGSVIAVSDTSGNAIGVNKYDEYGQPQGTITGRFGYTGQAWLPEVGLAYYKARMYHPGIGRFMQSDPIGYSAGQNLYGYVAGDPLNATDPSGMAVDEKGAPYRLISGTDLFQNPDLPDAIVEAPIGYTTSGSWDANRGDWLKDEMRSACEGPFAAKVCLLPGQSSKFERPHDPDPDKRRDQCGRPPPPATRTYSVPKGYSAGLDPKNVMIRDRQGKTVLNPYYDTVRKESEGINWSGARSDFFELGGNIALSFATGWLLEKTFGHEIGAALDAGTSVKDSALETALGLKGGC